MLALGDIWGLPVICALEAYEFASPCLQISLLPGEVTVFTIHFVGIRAECYAGSARRILNQISIFLNQLLASGR